MSAVSRFRRTSLRLRPQVQPREKFMVSVALTAVAVALIIIITRWLLLLEIM